jgi:hypothetical protein
VLLAPQSDSSEATDPVQAFEGRLNEIAAAVALVAADAEGQKMSAEDRDRCIAATVEVVHSVFKGGRPEVADICRPMATRRSHLLRSRTRQVRSGSRGTAIGSEHAHSPGGPGATVRVLTSPTHAERTSENVFLRRARSFDWHPSQCIESAEGQKPTLKRPVGFVRFVPLADVQAAPMPATNAVRALTS